LSGGGLVREVCETEQALLARARQGESGAFEQLYLEHRDQVYALCLNLCGQREEAQDLLQETFVRAYRGLRSFAGRSQFSTWVHSIAVNLWRDWLRCQRRLADLPPPASAADPGAPETAAEVRGILSRLRPQHRLVLSLRYTQALSYQEMAELLNWSLPRVKVCLHRARRAFKDAYLRAQEAEP
jgi:RNA polymerase sigma-70 factor (ECF subfamily)